MSGRLAVVIPAWRCEASIARSLSSLVAQRFDGRFQAADVHVIVAVNDGRADSLAAVESHRGALERAGYRLDVLRTPPGRRAAFAAAEALAAPGPRLYLDQDARLSQGALAALNDALGPDGAPFAAFLATYARSRSPAVRAFNRCHASLPYFSESPVLCGAYAVSQSGRTRWDALPALAADDKFVRLLFDPSERRIVAGETYEVLAPESFAALLINRVRYLRSNRALDAHFAGRGVADARRHKGLLRLLARPRSWADGLVFALASCVVVGLSWYRRAAGYSDDYV